jgi:hypothetical protein
VHKYARTYNGLVNLTHSIDAQTFARAPNKQKALGTNLNQLICGSLQKLAGSDDLEKSIEGFKRLSGRGNSCGWRFNRNEIHERW